jgi:N-acetyl-gamma-glutamyl-phosphate reductase
MGQSLKVGVVGAAGYTGAELVRLIALHPRLELKWVGARDRAGKTLASAVPATAGVPGVGDLILEPFDETRAPELAAKLDVAFTALPHGASAAAVASLFRAGLRVVDLSADFRLNDLETYEQWYGKHPAPELMKEAVYGLPELHREALINARLIAAPGCYPTGAILPVAPLLAEHLVESSGLVFDSKSGVTGAGRKVSTATHFAETSEGIRPYKVAGRHRHTPEIEQELGAQVGSPIRVVFTPHLAPLSRGILTCAYAKPTSPEPDLAERCREAARSFYDGTLVTVLDDEQLPDTLWVRGSARAHVAYAYDTRTETVLAFSAIDNLSRGSSAQAIQALNISMGWPEAEGLPQIGQFP